MLEVPLHLAGHQQAAGPIPPGSAAVHLLPAVPIPTGLTCVATGAAAALSPSAPAATPAWERSTTGRGGWWLASRPGWPPCAGRPALAAGRRPAGPGHPALAAATWACRCSRSASSTPTDPNRRPPCPSCTPHRANLEPQPGDSSAGCPRGRAAADPAVGSTAAAHLGGCCPTDLVGGPRRHPTKHAQAPGPQGGADARRGEP
jgi:hypothetical protein